MPSYLVALDTPGIKQFVFGTDALAEVRGASALLDRLNRHEMRTLLNNAFRRATFDLVFAAGGTGQFIIDEVSLDDVEKALAELAQRFRRETVGEARIVWGLAEFDGNDYQVAVDTAQTQMRLVRETNFGVSATTLLPLFSECSSVSHLPVQVKPFSWGSERQLLSEAAQRKRQASRWSRHNGPWAEWLAHLGGWPDDAEWLNRLRPQDAEVLAKARSGQKYVGLVYADGNAMGRLVQELDSRDACQKFSELVDTSVREACFTALETICGHEITAAHAAAKGNAHPVPLPADILLLGGDDLLVLLPADEALRFAQLAAKHFAQFTRDKIGALPDGDAKRFFQSKGKVATEGMTISCGVALAPAKYPFYLLFDLAEQLLKNAKRAGSEEMRQAVESGRIPEEDTAYWTPSYVDFHLITGTSIADLDIVREEDYRTSTSHRRTLRPYRLDRLEQLHTAVTQMQQASLSRTKLHELFEAALEPRAAVARRRLRDLFGRLRQQRQGEKGPCSQRQAFYLALYHLGKVTDFPWFDDGSTGVADLVEAFDLFAEEQTP